LVSPALISCPLLIQEQDLQGSRPDGCGRENSLVPLVTNVTVNGNDMHQSSLIHRADCITNIIITWLSGDFDGCDINK
jgi:hypothetical protein